MWKAQLSRLQLSAPLDVSIPLILLSATSVQGKIDTKFRRVVVVPVQADATKPYLGIRGLRLSSYWEFQNSQWT